MRLIDADAIPWDVEGVGFIPVIGKDEIDAMPEAVVRCKDCKFFSMTTLGMPFGACWHRADEINGLSGEDNGYTVCHRVDSPDFFCAWGERREDG